MRKNKNDDLIMFISLVIQGVPFMMAIFMFAIVTILTTARA